MAKKKTRRRRFSRLRKYVHRVPKLPLEVGVALVSIPFQGAGSGFASPIECIQANDWPGLGQNLTRGFLGFVPGEPPNLMQILSPFNMEYARYTKMLIIAGLISKVRKRLVKIPMKKIPLIGSWVS